MENNHDMLTRSKRKKRKINVNDLESLNSDISDDENLELTIQPTQVKKKKLKRQNAYNNVDDVDEYGNIKDLIDYNYFEPVTMERKYYSNDSEYEYTTDEDYEMEEFDDEEIDDEELLIGKLLSKFINKKIKEGNLDLSENKEYNELLLNYNPEMAEYFYSLDKEQKEEILKIEKEITNINKATTPLRFQILKSKISNDIKAIAIRKIETLKNLEPNSTEYYKIKGWVDGLLNIPFGIYKELPISLKNSKQEITQYLIDSNQTLNKAVFGRKK